MNHAMVNVGQKSVNGSISSAKLNIAPHFANLSVPYSRENK